MSLAISPVCSIEQTLNPIELEIFNDGFEFLAFLVAETNNQFFRIHDASSMAQGVTNPGAIEEKSEIEST